MMIAMTTKRATTTPAAIAVELLDLPPLELCGVAVARDTPPGMDETLVPLTVMAVVLTSEANASAVVAEIVSGRTTWATMEPQL